MAVTSPQYGSIALWVLHLFRGEVDVGVNLGTTCSWIFYFISLDLRFLICKMIILSALQGSDKN